MKTSLGLLLFVALGAGTCQAHLGETEAQCIARYGSEADVRDNLGFDVVGDKSASFPLKTAKSAFSIAVIFFNGIAAHETITSADPSLGVPVDQIAALLQAEGAGLSWSKGRTHFQTDRSDNTVALQTWTRSDGVTAQCYLSGKRKVQFVEEIELFTRDYEAAQKALEKQGGAA